MARKLRLTRPDLKRQRDNLARFTRYLPMLKLKQQQLQITIGRIDQGRRDARARADAANRRIDPYRRVLRDVAGINVEGLARPQEVATGEENVAGVRIPVFESVSFPAADYSLFATPPWVDRALADLRDLSERRARLEVLETQHELVQKALTKIVQRVNLFEKVLVPYAREAIRVIRIHLGEEQTAAVARAKLAKAKLAEMPQAVLAVSARDEEPPA